MAHASFCALFAVLLAYHHKSAPSWPQSLTINTVVAILTALMKSGVLLIAAEGNSHVKWTWLMEFRPLQHLSVFDSASRGPKGAFNLLKVVRTRHTGASLACIIGIFALAVDPFAQQLVRFYDCPTIHAGLASIPRSNWYLDPGRHQLAGFGQLQLDMQTSILTGILEDDTSNIAFTCPSGNCTFPEAYGTMAWCSSCTDVTHDLIYSQTNTTEPCIDYPGHNLVITNLSLPSGLNSYSLGCYGQSSSYTDFQDIAFVSNASLSSSGNPAFVEFIFTPEFYWSDNQSLPYCVNSSDWQCRGYGAARCELWPCVKKYLPSITAGKLTQSVISSSTVSDWSPLIEGLAYSLIDRSCLTEDQVRMFAINSTNTTASPQNWLPVPFEWSTCSPANSTAKPTPGFCNMTVPSGQLLPDFPAECFYEYYSLSQNNIENFLVESVFTGVVGLQFDSDTFIGSTVLQSFDTNSVFTDFVGPVYNRTDLSEFFNTSFETVSTKMDSLTTSITDRIRQYGNNGINGKPAPGTIGIPGTCVEVRWYWLIYPTLILLTTLVLLGVILFQVCQEHPTTGYKHDWKSSPLPLILPGLVTEDGNEDQAREINHPWTAQEIRQFAREITVRLKMDQDGWRFVKHRKPKKAKGERNGVLP